MKCLTRRNLIGAGVASTLGALAARCGPAPAPGPAGGDAPVAIDHVLTRAITHNRWNRDLPPRLTINSGETVSIETRDASDGHFTPASTVADTLNRDRDKIHPLTGPIAVNGAKPGDILQVDLLAYQLPEWGWTVVSPPFGFLGEEFTENHLQIWRFDRARRTADLRPGIRVPLNPFLGVIGLAWDETGEFRTMPPRTHGGNMDIKHLTAGTTVYLPVALPGGLLSVGDGHAAQGDGEVCVSAIECELTVQMRVTRRTDFSIVEPEYERPEYYATTGFGTDLIEAAKKATRHMIAWLQRVHGLSRNEAYVLCSVAMDLKINETVDMPHYLVSAHLPKSLFV